MRPFAVVIALLAATRYGAAAEINAFISTAIKVRRRTSCCRRFERA